MQSQKMVTDTKNQSQVKYETPVNFGKLRYISL